MSDEKPYPKLACLLAEAEALRNRHRAEDRERLARRELEWDALCKRTKAVQAACPHKRTRPQPFPYLYRATLCLDCGAEETDTGWGYRAGLVRTIR